MNTLLRPVATPTFEVLVVDDDPATVSALSDSLCGLARLRHVPDGYQALYEMTAHQIDVVVMELFLPGASGIELLHRMHANGLRVPTVVLTHAGSSHPELDALGVQHVLHKPASPDMLRAALTDVLTPPGEHRPLHAKRPHRRTTPASVHQGLHVPMPHARTTSVTGPMKLARRP